MAAAALVLYGISLTLTFGVRIALQVYRTGSTGVHGLQPGASPLERFAGALFVTSLAIGAAAPTLALLGVLDPLPALDGAAGHAIGLVLAVTGILLTFGAQLAMPFGLVTALELQVRFVEEPHLLRTHGGVYTGYAAHVGRFVPGLGLLHGVR